MEVYQEVKSELPKLKTMNKGDSFLKSYAKTTFPRGNLFSSEKQPHGLVKCRGLLLDLAEFFIFLWQVKYLILKVENVSKSCQSAGKKYKKTDAKDHEAN